MVQHAVPAYAESEEGGTTQGIAVGGLGATGRQG